MRNIVPGLLLALAGAVGTTARAADEPVKVVYTFPLPEKAAVDHLRDVGAVRAPCENALSGRIDRSTLCRVWHAPGER